MKMSMGQKEGFAQTRTNVYLTLKEGLVTVRKVVVLFCFQGTNDEVRSRSRNFRHRGLDARPARNL